MKINVSQMMAHYPLVVKSIKGETIVCSDFFKEWNKDCVPWGQGKDFYQRGSVRKQIRLKLNNLRTV